MIMPRHFFLLLVACFAVTNAGAGNILPEGSAEGIRFIENKGQWQEGFLFKAQIPGGSLYLEKDRFTFDLTDQAARTAFVEQLHKREKATTYPDSMSVKAHAFQLIFEEANPSAQLHKEEIFPSYSNYFIGSDPSRWRSNVQTAGRVVYKDIYAGIDLQIYSESPNIKYDFIVQAGANADNISLAYNGLNEIYLKKGRLHMKTSLGEIIEQEPYCYQVINGKSKEVPCRYVLENGSVKFEFPKSYDKSYPLVIDPVLIFASFSGSVADNFGFTATYDEAGNLYGGGIAFNTNYPTTTGAYQTTFRGKVDIAVSKFSASGSTLLYSTYIGGSEADAPHSLVVNANNELFVYGTTGSSNYPVTAGVVQTTFRGGTTSNTGSGFSYPNGSDIIISKLSADGTQMLASTYFGGTRNDGLNESSSLARNYGDTFRGEVIVDGNGDCYIASTTASTDFPVLNATQGTFRGGAQDACVFKLNSSLSAISWSTFLGGSADDAGYSLQLNSSGDVYVTGGTTSNNLTTTGGALKTAYSGNTDGFITRLSSSGNTILNSTYIGTGSYDQCYFVQLDELDDVYVVGQTQGAYPVQAGPSGTVYSNTGSGQFIHKLNPQLTATVFSTVFGTGSGSPDIVLSAFLVNVCGHVYVSGWGGSVNQLLSNHVGGSTTGLPITSNAFQPTTDGSDFYLIVLTENAESLLYGTFFGGNLSSEHVDGGTSRFDKNGIVYQAVCGGCGRNSDFPVTSGAWSETNNSSNCNLAVIKFDMSEYNALIGYEGPTLLCVNSSVVLENTSTGGTSYLWDFGDGTGSTSFNVSHTYADTGTYTVMLIAFENTSCKTSDTAFLTLEVKPPPTATAQPVYTNCPGNTVQLQAQGGAAYQWQPSSGLNNPNIANPVAVVNTVPVTYSVIVSDQCGSDTAQVTVQPFQNTITASGSDSICPGDTAQISASGGVSYSWSPASTLSDAAVSNPLAFPAATTNYIVTATDTNGCSFNDTVTVTVRALPVAIPAIDSVTPPCINQVINFTNLSVGGTSFLWDFGDGQTSTLYNPSHLYSAAGSYTVTLTIYDGTCGYSDTAYMPVNVKPDPVAVLASEERVCPQDSVQLFASGGVNYLWKPSLGLSNDTIPDPFAYFPSTATIYTVIVSDECGQDSASITVNPISFFISVSEDDTICAGSSIPLFATGGSSYLWSPVTWLDKSTVPSPLATPPVTTVYSVTVTDTNGCTLSANIKIEVENYPVIDAGADVTICSGAETQLSASGGYNHLWNPPAGLSDTTVSNPVARPDSTTTYAVTTVNTCGSATDNVTIRVNKIPRTGGDTSVCLGDTSTLYAPQGYNYSWSPAVSIAGDNTAAPVIWPAESINYTVTITDDIGCSRTDTILVEVNPPPLVDAGNDVIIDFGESALLKAETSANQYIWEPYINLSCNNCAAVYASPEATTTYMVLVTDENNCKATDSVTVILKGSLYIPNSFTPNGDNLNDIFKAAGTEIKEFHMQVFNRWGELIFVSDDINTGWDGTHNGQPAQMDVYVWKVKYEETAGNSHQRSGHVNLVR